MAALTSHGQRSNELSIYKPTPPRELRMENGGTIAFWGTPVAPAKWTTPEGFTVLGSRYYVRKGEVEEQLPSGLIIPQTAVMENHNDGEVVFLGPGKAWNPNSGVVQKMQADPLDRVIFTKEAFEGLSPDGREGFVCDEDLIAVLPGPFYEEVEPANGWVFIRTDPAPTHTEGGLEIPQDQRRRPNSGRIQDWGPGEVRTTGPYAGTRKTVRDIIGLSKEEKLTLYGARVHWTDAAVVIELTDDHDGVDGILVHARDLVAIEIP